MPAINYFFFITFFPQLIAGPLFRKDQFLPQLTHRRFHNPSLKDGVVGLVIFVIGLFKKCVLADGLAQWATPIFDGASTGADISLFEAWIGLLSYTLQLYFDFSGYTDMAIGLARIVGVRLPVNFLSPYKAASVADFWRRWHISLSSFLRDYLYVPLGGDRNGRWRQKGNILITMLLGGIWHGAGWNFILWGLLQGLFLSINHYFSEAVCFSRKQNKTNRLFIRLTCCRTLTIFCIMIGWVLFRAETIDSALAIYKGLFFMNGISLPESIKQFSEQNFTHFLPPFISFHGVSPNDFLTNPKLALVVIPLLYGFIFLAPNTTELMERYDGIGDDVKVDLLSRSARFNVSFHPNSFWVLFIAVLFVLSLGHMTDAKEFVYFQF